jgi:hypothetical protein
MQKTYLGVLVSAFFSEQICLFNIATDRGGIEANVRSRETQSLDTQVARVTRAKPRFPAESARKKFFAARWFASIFALTASGA